MACVSVSTTCFRHSFRVLAAWRLTSVVRCSHQYQGTLAEGAGGSSGEGPAAGAHLPGSKTPRARERGWRARPRGAVHAYNFFAVDFFWLILHYCWLWVVRYFLVLLLVYLYCVACMRIWRSLCPVFAVSTTQCAQRTQLHWPRLVGKLESNTLFPNVCSTWARAMFCHFCFGP